MGLRKYEAEYEKCFYLFRTSYTLCQSTYTNIYANDDETEIAYFKGFYYSLIVNYSNQHTGTVPRSRDLRVKRTSLRSSITCHESE